MALTDSIAALTVPVKLLATVLPERVQYIGPWRGGGQEPRVCGNPLAAETRLPPTVDTVAFRGLLDGGLRKLHRPPATTFVDPEGEAVWLHEYVALRVSGASDTRACDRVLTAIRQIIGR